jgi:hypothetical protein
MNRHERRAQVTKALIASTRGPYGLAADGECLAVVRPQRPELAIAIANVALAKQDTTVLEQLPDDDYTFVGWLSADGTRVLDEEGRAVGELQRGDSLVTLKRPPSPICALCGAPTMTVAFQIVELDGRKQLVHVDCWANRTEGGVAYN